VDSKGHGGARRRCYFGAAALAGTLISGGSATASDTHAHINPILIPGTNLSIDHLEITQGIQRVDNSIEAIAARATAVRAFIKKTNLTGLSVSNVQGRLQVYSGTTLLVDALSDNGPITATTSPDREAENSTLNFTFIPPYASPATTLTFVVTVDPFNVITENNEGDNVHSEDKGFTCRIAPDIGGVSINYTSATEPDATTLGEPDPNLIQQGVGDAMVWGTYPFPEYDAGDQDGYWVEDAPPLTWSQNIDGSSSSLITELEAHRAGMSPMPDQVFGFFRGNPYSGNGATFLNFTAAFGNTDPARYQRTFAHELSHDAGNDHNDYGPSPDHNIEEVGWDVLDRVELGPVKSASLFDLMVAGRLTDEAWVHPDHYEQLDSAFGSSCVMLIPPDWLDFNLITGRLPVGGVPFQIDPIFQFRSLREPIVAGTVGRARIRLKNAASQIIYETAFDSEVHTDGGQATPSAGFAVAVPVLADATQVEVLMDGRVVGRANRSAKAPLIAITSPQPGAVLDGIVDIRWSASDADRNPLRATLQYTPDGERYFPLTGRITGTQTRVDLARVPASETGRIVLRVSDGFRTSVAEVANLHVGHNHAPVVHITGPAEQQEFAAGANVTLLGRARDAEDGPLAGASLTWSSDVDGVLGTGPALNRADLTPGAHRIELRATDSGGSISVRTVSIIVR
jgi:hypothetical protein